MCLVSVVGCGPTLPFEMREGQPWWMAPPPSIHANKPSLTMKRLVRPLGGGIYESGASSSSARRTTQGRFYAFAKRELKIYHLSY